MSGSEGRPAIDAETLGRVLDAIDTDLPPALEVAERLADATAVDVADAQDTVYAALDAGILVEEGEGYGGVRLAEGVKNADSVKDTDSNPEEGVSGDETPTPEAVETPSQNGEGRESAAEALAAAVEWFHQQLDADLPQASDYDTPRDYYREGRGWDDETIDTKRLGWAPGDTKDRLLAHLHGRGFDRETILATGLFGERDDGNLYATWSGRYVLPYPDEDGRPVFAISRAADPVHPADWKGNKYDKLPVSWDDVDLTEPIYGLDTVREGEPVLVTEGIADAITAHQAGYSCVSPVTTTFKKDDRQRLADEFLARGVDRAYIVQDAEAPGSDIDERERLTLPQFGEGVRGAVSTGAFLDAAGVDAYIGELPRPGLQKVDLDDYIRDWGALAPVLASAKPATEHPAFEAEDPNDTNERAYRAPEKTGSASSALFDLDLVDVAPVGAGERTTNPLGHHGESENYYVVDDDGETAYDHKYKATYTALTHLLADARERDADAPEGALSDVEVFVAWHTAKEIGALGSDDPVPYRGLRGLAVRDGLVDRDELVRRDSDTGEVVDEEGDARDTYLALPPGAYNRALGHVEDEYGVAPGREAAGRGDDTDDSEEYGRDPRELGATVDPRRAWDAAGRVTPDEVDDDRLGAADSDPEAFACPECGASVDVVRAVAVREGLVDTCDDTVAEEYPEAYNTARENYGAPLPRYYSTADAVAEFDAVLDMISEVTFWHLDDGALASEITARDDEIGGDAVRALNPAWRESESGESVLVFESGTVWDADSERVLDALRFVALDSGLIDAPDDDLGGGRFTEAYNTAREEYGAPLPRWEPAEDGAREVTPMLPPSEELVDGRDLDGVDRDALTEAREDVEALIADAVADADTPTVITALPALGKTTGTVKAARETPLSYLAPRKELQAQALDKAERWGVDARILPVFSEERVRDEVLSAAVSHVRELGKTRLRDRWAILAAAVGGDDGDASVDPSDIFEEDEEENDDEVHLDRATCDTAEGKHGVAWALAVHVARRLGYTPSEIHREARGLFGAPLPCEGDHDEDAECTYSAAWSEVSDPDAPAELLVGSRVHAHVESVRTVYGRDADGSVVRSPRPVVLDEFPGEAFTRDFGEEAEDHATWLARALRDDVDDRRDMFAADLWGDEWVRAWLDGQGDEHDAVADAAAALARVGDLLDAREGADDVRAEVDTDVLEELGLDDPLARLGSSNTDPADAFGELTEAVAGVEPENPLYGIAGWVEEAVVEPLARATLDGSENPSVDGVDTDDAPIGGDLKALVDTAVEAAKAKNDNARGALKAAATALTGGREGCRRLAAWAEDGYAHPDAHHLLRGAITPTGDTDDPEAGRRVMTDNWAFDPDSTEGTVLDVVDTTERATVVADRNGHGALLHTPPSRTAGGGEDVPLVGLDATGRAALWSVALGEDVDTADIHDTPTERAAFLEDALNLRVLQASDIPRYYEGSPESKDTDGDVALLEALADEYAGIEAPRQRGDAPTTVGKPAAITTKGVREFLENDPRLDGVVDAWDNYGNVTGSNELGNHRLAAILGCQHYGDHAIERFCALAGEEVDTTRVAGRGAELSYGNDLADEYLAHMSQDQTMQAILRFARGDSGATVVARTSALREDLPVVGRAQVAETWSKTATAIARQYRRLGSEFTAADVREVVDVTPRQVRRVLAELVEAGYLRREDHGVGRAHTYERITDPGAGEVDLPERDTAVDAGAAATPGRSSSKQYYTANVRVFGGESGSSAVDDTPAPRVRGAPPAPAAVTGTDTPG